MSTTLAILLADGAEPVEVIAPLDAWRRGDVDVTCISIMGRRSIKLAQGLRMEADATLDDVVLSSFDALFIPGGSVGVDNLLACKEVANALREFATAGKFIFSICAGPMVLNAAGILKGRRATCYPGCETDFPAGTYPGHSGIVHDGNLVTASGPAYALDFGLVCLAVMTTQSNADKVSASMLANLA